jgi:glycosyltransferase involved in cell wall biosynthesis
MSINLAAIQATTGQTACLKGAKVIVLLGPLELGGAERQALMLARHLRNEHLADVEIWGDQEPGALVELCEDYGVPWRLVTMALPWSKSRLKQLIRLASFAWTLRRARPDVILPYKYSQRMVGGLVWRLTGARTCVWSEYGGGRKRVGGRPEQWAARLTKSFIANSQHGVDFLTEALKVDPNSVCAVRDAVKLDPPQLDRAAWRRRLEIDPDSFVACMIANLKRSKDHVTLLEAWRIVVDRLETLGQKAVLVLAGRFDETHESLKARAYDLELFDSVRFPGQVKDVSGLAGAVDLCVYSVVSEISPRSVLECMAAGLAVAGTDCPGLREAVGPLGLPFLSAPGNEQEFADRIFDLAVDPALRAKLGVANRQRIEAEFRQSRMFEETVAVIAQGLSLRTSRTTDSAALRKRAKSPFGTAGET